MKKSYKKPIIKTIILENEGFICDSGGKYFGTTSFNSSNVASDAATVEENTFVGSYRTTLWGED